jgi:acetyl-CoA carboxylase biotin carboxyl carrier protein
MDLTNEDVTDILALLDSLPYDELDLQTPRFRLTLRRTPDGWTQAVEARAVPTVVDAAPAGGASVPAGGTAAGAAAAGGATAAAVAGAATPTAATAPTATAATDPMFHRVGDNRPNVPSGRLGSEAGGTGGTGVSTEVSSKPTAPEAGAAMKHRCRSGGSDVSSVSSGDGLVAVRAPLPGTFYRAPRPGAAPFVEVGSRVGADTVVGIVETMKLFNSVTADAAGTVAEICLDNAEFADRGATLLRIRTD